MNRVRFAVLGSALLALGACESEPPAATPSAGFPVLVHVRAEGQTGVPDAELSLGGQALGKSDADGNARFKLHGNEGDTVSVNVKCPSRFASPERPLLVGLRHLGNGSTAARFETDCFSMVHTVIVGVRAENGPHLPILRLKSVVGVTDDAGIAHVQLQAAPNEQIALTLDTSKSSSLLPQNPTLDFVTRDADELVLVSQKFTLKQAPPKRIVARSIPRHL